jgi:integrase
VERRANPISKRWAKGADGETKTAASNGYVPMHPALAQYLKEWREQSPHSKVDDFVFRRCSRTAKCLSGRRRSYRIICDRRQ